MRNKFAILLSIITLSGCSTIKDVQYSMLEDKTEYKESKLDSNLTGNMTSYSYLEYLSSDDGHFITHEYGCIVYEDKHRVSTFSYYMGLAKDFEDIYFNSTPVYIKSSDFLEMKIEGIKFINILSGLDISSTKKTLKNLEKLSLSEKYIISIPELNKTFKSKERNVEKALKVTNKCFKNYYIEMEKSKLKEKNKMQLI